MLFAAFNCIITPYYSSVSGKTKSATETTGKGHRIVDQLAHYQAEQIECYLRNVGIRPSAKAYQYLTFALTQLLQGTPFRESIWELTAIHFDQSRKNVLACVRRELLHSFAENPARFTSGIGACTLKKPPSTSEFLRLSFGMVSQYPDHPPYLMD